MLQLGEAEDATKYSYMEQKSPHHTKEYIAFAVDSVEAANSCSVLCSFKSESEFSIDWPVAEKRKRLSLVESVLNCLMDLQSLLGARKAIQARKARNKSLIRPRYSSDSKQNFRLQSRQMKGIMVLAL